MNNDLIEFYKNVEILKKILLCDYSPKLGKKHRDFSLKFIGTTYEYKFICECPIGEKICNNVVVLTKEQAENLITQYIQTKYLNPSKTDGKNQYLPTCKDD